MRRRQLEDNLKADAGWASIGSGFAPGLNYSGNGDDNMRKHELEVKHVQHEMVGGYREAWEMPVAVPTMGYGVELPASPVRVPGRESVRAGSTRVPMGRGAR
jgi:hypothetical protein